MIGFDAIGAIAIGELDVEGDVLIFAPVASDITVTSAAPVVRGGASASPGSGAVTVTRSIPTVVAGVLVTVPNAAVTVTAATPRVEISATDTVPGVAVVVASAAPVVLSGASEAPAVAAVAVTRAVPAVAAGKSEFPVAAAVSVAAHAPGISISATETVPGVAIDVTPLPPQILGGNYIEATNTVTMVTTFGEIGSSSIAEFAIGEGDVSTRVVKIPPIIIVSRLPPLVLAGKSEFPPVANINVTTSRAEIESRARKLRLLAIAS